MHKSLRMPNLDHLAVAYLDSCATENDPPNTLARRRSVLASLPNAGTATREEVEAWWAGRHDLAATTRASDLSLLRSFYAWAELYEHRKPEDNPTRRIRAPKVPKGMPRPMSRHDVLTLMGRLPDDLRRAVALGAYAGLRVSEAARLVWPDVDLEHSRMRVLGKGAKTRMVGLSPLLLDSLLPDTGGNVVTGRPKGYTAANLQRKVNRAIHAAGIQGTFHTLRHRYATVGLAATGDLLAVSRALGHASTSTTAVYAAMSDDALDKIALAVTQ